MLPFAGLAQRQKDKIDIQVKPVSGNVICDTCPINYIYHLSEKSRQNYAILNATEEKPQHDNTPENMRQATLFTEHHILESEFTIDFLSRAWRFHYPEMSDDFIKLTEAEEDEDNLWEFSVYINSDTVQHWKPVRSLVRDPDFEVGYFLQTTQRKNKYFKLKNYQVGNYKLNMNDSLVILIRFKDLSEMILQSILIKRVPATVSNFDFLKFSSDTDLQDILNLQTASSNIVAHSDTIFEMKSNEIALLRFRDTTKTKKQIEYSFNEATGEWKTISAGSGYSYILINKPAPGKDVQLALRYSLQKETMHRITIKVQENFFSSVWFKILLAVAVVSLVFSVWWLIKKQQHARQLRKLSFSKAETESKLELLSGQLNPHFLFNSLNSVQNLINKKDTENANLYISEVSGFLRTVMDTGKKEYISLEEELKIEEAYMQLEQKRKDFSYEIINHCSVSLSLVEFPPLLLQPIIENSIHHGFSRQIAKPAITIELHCNNKTLHVSVKDNGQGLNSNVINKGHGLNIVQKRILLMNEKLKDIAVEMIVDSSGKGTATTFVFQNWL